MSPAADLQRARYPDLFWACRGGGGGSFGVATSFTVQLHRVATVIVFRVVWLALSTAVAAAVMKAWQNWAPHAPQTIDSNLVIVKGSNGTVNMHAAGQSVGTMQELRRELKALPKSQSAFTKQMTFSDAVAFFAGRPGFPVQSMKGKSDYASAPISDEGLDVFMTGLARSSGINRRPLCRLFLPYMQSLPLVWGRQRNAVPKLWRLCRCAS